MKRNCEMHLHDNITVRVKDKKGNTVRLFKANKFLSKLGLKVGRFVEELHAHNVITTAGFAQFGNIATNGSETAKFKYVAVGSGNTAATAADTALETEISSTGMARSEGSHSASGATQTVSATFTNNDVSDKTVYETGVFDNSSAGVMLNRYVFGSPINLEPGSSIEIDHEFTLS